MSEKYWATKPSEEIIAEMTARTAEYYDYIYKWGILSRWRLAYKQYYQGHFAGARPLPHGRVGELTHISINHYRNLLHHILVLTTSSRFSYDAQASNSDYKSAAQTIIANGVLDYYMRSRHLEENIKTAVEHSLVFDAGYVVIGWDPDVGDVVAVASDDMGNPIEAKAGDIFYKNKTPLDVTIDISAFSYEDIQWHIVRDHKNKFDLAAKYPDLYDKIVSGGYDDREKDLMFWQRYDIQRTDNIPVYTLYHDRCDSLPEGRMVVKCADVVLFDGPLPYKESPVYRVTGSDAANTVFGYSVSNELLPIQIVYDELASAAVTNLTSFAIQNVWLPKGHGLSLTQLEGRLNVLEGDPKVGKPEPLNLTQSAPELYQYLQSLERTMEVLSGVNSVQRGNPESSLKAASALALVQSMALQFSSGLQHSMVTLSEKIGTGIVNMIKQYAKAPRVAQIAGKANKMYLKEFVGEDIKDIDFVLVNVGNALSKTPSGRIQMAESYMEKGFIKTPEEFNQVVETGRIDPIIEADRAEMMLIREENEKLAEGQPTSVIETDNHMKHIMEHRSVLANCDVRNGVDQTVVQVTMQHMDEHIQMLQQLSQNNPELLVGTGQQPLPPPPPPMPPAPPQGAPGVGPQVGQPDSPMMEGGQPIAQPKLPKNPMTGQPNQIPGVNA